MFGQVLARCLQTCASLRAVEKAALMELRKKTGYTFSNCKKALEANNNDLTKAEKWLAEEAKKQGWAKATKMQSRSTAQGLIGIHVDGPYAAMAEVNCETDFVARTPEFQKFVEQLVRSCFSHAKKLPSLETAIMKVRLGAPELGRLRIRDGHTVAEAQALAVGKLGEKVAVRRALCLRGEAGTTRLAGYCHPQDSQADGGKKYPCYGRYGALVAYRELGDSPLAEEEMEELGRHLCQQVVALNPQTVGLLDDYLLFEEHEERMLQEEEKSKEKKSEEGEAKKAAAQERTLESAQDTAVAPEEEQELPVTEEEEVEETRLLFQEYVVDPSIRVGHVVSRGCIDIMDFERFACGESTDKTTK